MDELERALVADSFAAPPEHILEGIDEPLAHRGLPGSPHTIYAELWHITSWQQISLDWVNGIATAVPEHADLGFPGEDAIKAEPWAALVQRFLAGMQAAGAHAADRARLELEQISCGCTGSSDIDAVFFQGKRLCTIPPLHSNS